ncbi:MAG: hypothetical protein AAGA56_27115, partial [Myxococcota bacterium]
GQARVAEQARLDFERSEAELAALLGVTLFDPGRPPLNPPDAGPPGPGPGAPLAGGEVCGRACKALTSMRRAAERLCVLTGADDARCQEASKRTRIAEQRVKAQCPSCE